MREKKKNEEEDQNPPEEETTINLRRSETHPPDADHDDDDEHHHHPLRPGVANPVATPAFLKHPLSRSRLTTLLIRVAEVVRVVQVEEEVEEEVRRN